MIRSKFLIAAGVLLALVATSTDALANRFRLSIAHRGPQASIPLVQTAPAFMNKTKLGYGAVTVNYTGLGTIAKVPGSETCDGVASNRFTIVSGLLYMSGAAGGNNTLGSITSCTLQASDSLGATSTITIPIECCGFSVSTWAEAVAAFRSSLTAWGDQVRVRAGNYSIPFPGSSTDPVDDIMRTVDYLPGPNGETLPINRQSTGWVKFKPDPGATVKWTGLATLNATSGKPAMGIKIEGMRFYLAGSAGTQVYNGFGALEIRNASQALSHFWIDNNDISSSFNQTAYDAAKTACGGCVVSINNYIFDATKKSGLGISDFWVTRNNIHDSMNGLVWGGTRAKIIGNTFKGQWQDGINGLKSNSDIAFNIITDKNGIGGAHGDYTQDSYDGQNGPRTGNKLIANYFSPGVADGLPGQVISGDYVEGTGAGALRVTVEGQINYGNFIQGEHARMLSWGNCNNCKFKFNTIVHGHIALTSNPLTIYNTPYPGDTSVIGPLVLSGTEINYNVTRAVSAGGSNSNTADNDLWSSNIVTDYAARFVNPERLKKSYSVPELQANWAPKAGGPLTPAGRGDAGYTWGAIQPGVDFFNWTATFPDGYTYDGNVD